jgi:hypothetical protein
MPQRLELALRRVLEVVLVVATVATAYAAIRGQVSAVTLGAIVPVLVAISAALGWLNRGQRSHCVHAAARKRP